MTRSLKCLIAAALFLLVTRSALAEVSLSSLFSDGIVVQRNMPIHIWGKAALGERVTVTFRQETKSATTDALEHWEVYMTPTDAGGPYDLIVRGTNSVVIHDVLVGDVWVASGQSNMEMPMRQVDNAETEIAAADYPQIRLFRLRRASSEFPLYDAAD